MDPTARIAQAWGATVSEVGRGGHVRAESDWRMFNDAGVEVEVGEFLYGLVRLAKPLRVLETGTHKGIAMAYVGLALAENGEGKLTSVEFNAGLAWSARNLAAALGLNERVEVVCDNTLHYTPAFDIDLLLLDTEPPIRFDEFDRFYSRVTPGGFVAIHDLHPHAGRTFQVLNGMRHWPYGDLMDHELGAALARHELAAMPFHTPRGFMLFQRQDPAFVPYQIAAGRLEDREFYGDV